MESGLTTADYGWGTKNFRQLGLRKTELIINLLRAGADPVLTDADALITRDPSPFIARLLPEAQILVTSDHLMSTTQSPETELEDPWRSSSSAWNIGYMYLRHDVLPAMLHWQAECAAHPNLWDQNLFKDVLKIGGLKFREQVPEPARSKRLFLGYNGTITIGILPVATYCSGHTYFVQRMPQRMTPPIEPFTVHTTFQYSGAIGKTHRLREAMMWYDEPSYYAPRLSSRTRAQFSHDFPQLSAALSSRAGAPRSAGELQSGGEIQSGAGELQSGSEIQSGAGELQGFLSFDLAVQRHLVRPAGVMDVSSHFALVHPQLTQVRAALLLARRLQRILILPKLVCGLDRFWAPHNGTIPGSDTMLPIDPCPADHVLDLEHMARTLDGTIEGMLREYSFLDNPRAPKELIASRRVLQPPAGLSADALAILSTAEMRSVRVLHFERMPDLYATLPADEGELEQQRMRDWVSIWCCSKPPNPKAAGHVWYDFFWDVIPHTNRHRKLVSGPWEWSFGP